MRCDFYFVFNFYLAALSMHHYVKLQDFSLVWALSIDSERCSRYPNPRQIIIITIQSRMNENRFTLIHLKLLADRARRSSPGYCFCKYLG